MVIVTGGSWLVVITVGPGTMDVVVKVDPVVTVWVSNNVNTDVTITLVVTGARVLVANLVTVSVAVRVVKTGVPADVRNTVVGGSWVVEVIVTGGSWLVVVMVDGGSWLVVVIVDGGSWLVVVIVIGGSWLMEVMVIGESWLVVVTVDAGSWLIDVIVIGGSWLVVVMTSVLAGKIVGTNSVRNSVDTSVIVVGTLFVTKIDLVAVRDRITVAVLMEVAVTMDWMIEVEVANEV
jgi:hypothetical protein